jgi:hypothetical protein
MTRLVEFMDWISASEKDTDSAALEKRLWNATELAVPALISGLKSQEYSGGRLHSDGRPQGPVLGLILLLFGKVRFATQRTNAGGLVAALLLFLCGCGTNPRHVTPALTYNVQELPERCTILLCNVVFQPAK